MVTAGNRVKASESFSTMYRPCLRSRARSVEAYRQRENMRENSRERQPSHDSCPYASYGAVHSCPQSRVHTDTDHCAAQ